MAVGPIDSVKSTNGTKQSMYPSSGPSRCQFCETDPGVFIKKPEAATLEAYLSLDHRLFITGWTISEILLCNDAIASSSFGSKGVPILPLPTFLLVFCTFDDSLSPRNGNGISYLLPPSSRHTISEKRYSSSCPVGSSPRDSSLRCISFNLDSAATLALSHFVFSIKPLLSFMITTTPCSFRMEAASLAQLLLHFCQFMGRWIDTASSRLVLVDEDDVIAAFRAPTILSVFLLGVARPTDNATATPPCKAKNNEKAKNKARGRIITISMLERT
mmetsp:Transcript_30547/g.46281  ORF Transcript_30547/g.46281 Transcript_30547/m.46281 type:complete len:273 (+) Transcript_30547:331-1149(+)